MTEKLYYNDPHKLEFEAEIISVDKYGDKYSVLLDKSYFYPTSGGQPFDTGSLNGIKVIDVFEQDTKVFHITEKAPEIGKASGKIDYLRRLEHMQHHTGQHLLSQAFIRIANAPTVSFHLGSESASIEILTAELSQEQINATEELANDIIYQNRKINVLYVDEEEANELELRKKPKKKCVSGDIRVIEIEDFDISPCGGTHALSTGELGIIKIISWEKYKGNTKVEFLCGRRALMDYRFKNICLKKISSKFSASERDIEAIIEKSIEESKQLQRNLTSLKKEMAGLQAKELREKAININDNEVVFQAFEEIEPDQMKNIGIELIKNQKTIAFLFSIYNQRSHLIFCCSENISINMNEYAKAVFQLINGKGGGKPNFVQGSGEKHKLEELLDLIKQKYTAKQ